MPHDVAELDPLPAQSGGRGQHSRWLAHQRRGYLSTPGSYPSARAATSRLCAADLRAVDILCRVENGPTQVVPGSHLSERQPNTQDAPAFQGKCAVSMLGNAGDAYMFNNQMWHRGAPNVRSEQRLLGGTTYAQRRISQRLFPHADYHMPQHVLSGPGPRLQRMLGRHDTAAYA